MTTSFAFSQQVQQPEQKPSCAIVRTDHYDCNRDAFLHRLAQAKSIRIHTARMDSYGEGQMQKLVAELGKQVAANGQPFDLIFELVKIDHAGRIEVGPYDISFAYLKVFDPVLGSGDAGLVWAETLDGPSERPWPAAVLDVVKQFRAHIAGAN